ncbi:MAG: hypothetical protein AB1529_08290 [Candidatus Micrarchaeota archaeon]
MIESITKAFNAYSKNPFLFVWGSLMYIILLIAFFFAALGVVLAYFISLSMFGKDLDPSALPTMAIFGVIGLLFVFFSGGLNAALARAYRSAAWKEKMSLTKFYSYALDKAPEMFGVMLLRDLLWLLLAGPFIAVFVYFVSDVEFMDVLLYLYLLFVTFVVHLLFTPAFISAGALGTDFFSSMKHAFDFLRKRHIFFITMYSLFAVVWILNFIPFVQFVTIFFAYPVLYASMIVMMEDSLKIKADEGED